MSNKFSISTMSPAFINLYGKSVDLVKLVDAINSCIATDLHEVDDSRRSTANIGYKGTLSKDGKDSRRFGVALKSGVRFETTKGKLPMPLQVWEHDKEQSEKARFTGDYAPLGALLSEYLTSRYAKVEAESKPAESKEKKAA